MYKSLIIILLVNFNIFAQTQSIYKRVDTVEKNQDSLKFNIQKIQEIELENINTKITSLENKTNELKNYEKDILQIKSLTENNEKITNLQNERIGDIHSSIDRFSYIAALFGVLVTAIVIFFTFNLKQIARKEAEDAIEEELKIWMKEKGTKILNQEAKPLLDIIRAEREEQNKAFDKLVGNFKNITSEGKRQLAHKSQILEKKQNKTFDDWFTLSLNAYYLKEYSKSYEYLDNAEKLAIDDYQIIEAMIGKGVIREFQKNYIASIEICNDIIKIYQDYDDNIIKAQVIRTTVHKAYRYSLNDDEINAIKIYNEIFENYNISESEAILRQVSHALNNKMELCIINNQKMTKNEIEFMKNYSKQDLRFEMKFKLLNIISTAQLKSQEEEMYLWQNQYRNQEFSIWYYQLLENWSNTIKDTNIKYRIQKYLKVFKNYVKS